MGEKTSGNLSVDMYLSKQEGLLLEHIRRMLQGETKISLLEAALQEMYKKNEELTQQVDAGKVALDQAINGLSAVTAERNALSAKAGNLESALATSRADLNKVIIEKSEVEKLTLKLNALETDYNTLKTNYNLVLEQYNAMNPAVTEEVLAEPTPVPDKKKKTKNIEPEWTDGKY